MIPAVPALFCAAFAAMAAGQAPASPIRPDSIAAGTPGPSPSPPGMRLLLGFDEYGWVADTVALAGKLAFAHRLGFTGFLCHFAAPSRAPGNGGPIWVRGPRPGGGWKLSTRPGPGGKDGRRAWVDRIKSVKRITEASGMDFIPSLGAFGWGADYHAIDPATMAGEYLEIAIPDPSPNLFLGKAKSPILSRTRGWGDGAAELRFDSVSGDMSKVSVRLDGAGLYAAQWRIEAPWDAYLRCRMPVAAAGNGNDSAFLKVYWAIRGAPLPRGLRFLSQSGGPVGKAPAELELGFFVRRGETYLLDLEYHRVAGGAGTLEAGSGTLARAAPPRDMLVDAPGMRALISSRRPLLKDFRWSALRGARADSAWASLSAVRGTFQDALPDNRLRRPVDPLAPATRQITAELLDAAAEAAGPGPGFLHLGGDEFFSLHRSRRQRLPPFSGFDPARLFAYFIRDRAAQADSAFIRRYPGSRLPVYLVYGDMLTRFNGEDAGTMAAGDSLARSPALRGRLIAMPWYDASMVSRLPPCAPSPPPADPEGRRQAFLGLLREDAGRFSRLGMDFIGLYSNAEAGTGMGEQAYGADSWARVCGEFAEARPGRCLGLAYSGWDPGPHARWGSNYNGMLMLARTWAGRPGLDSDADGDGILDSLRGAEASR